MQSVSSSIWTRIAVFISYGDNDYTTDTDGHAYRFKAHLVIDGAVMSESSPRYLVGRLTSKFSKGKGTKNTGTRPETFLN